MKKSLLLAGALLVAVASFGQKKEIKKAQKAFTKGDIERRIANASNQPTYLLSDVEVVATYELYNLDAGKLENIIHKIFSNAKLDIELKDRFGKPYNPREWFLVPLPVVREAIDKIKDGTISNYLYNINSGQLEISS